MSPSRLLFLATPLALAIPAAAQLPQIDSVTPTFAQFPSVISITGQNLDDASVIEFGSTPGMILGSSDDFILAIVDPVPPGLTDVFVVAPGGSILAAEAAEFFPNLELEGGTELGGPIELTLNNGLGGSAILAYSFGSTAPVPIIPWHFGLELDLTRGFDLLGSFVVPANGVVTSSMTLPEIPELVGLEIFYQAFSTLQPTSFLVGGGFSDTESAVVTSFGFEPPSNLVYQVDMVQYPFGVEIVPNLPTLDSFADDWSITPDLPMGLLIDPLDGIISGTPDTPSPLTTYTVTASNPAGSTTATLEIGVEPPITLDAPRFAYAANSGDGTLSIFEFDGNTGRLAAAGYAITGGTPTDLVTSPDESELFVLDGANDAVHVYSIDGDTGQLTVLDTSPFALPSGSGASGLALTPDGALLYVANTTLNSVTAFTVAIDGELGPIAGSPFATAGLGPVDVVVASDGGRLFGICRDSNELFAQEIAGDGTLSAEVLAVSEDQPAAIATLENGNGDQVVFIGHANSSNIQTALLDSTGSLLVFATLDTGGNVAALEAVEFAGGEQVLYAGNTTLETVQRLTIELDGQLTPITETTVVTEFDPIAIDVARDGSTSVTLFELPAELSVSSVDAANNGELTLINIGDQPVDRNRLRSEPTDVVIVHGEDTLARTSTALLSANYTDDDISQFSFDGIELTAQTPFTADAGEGPNSIVIHPRLDRAYVVNNSDTMGAGLQVFDLDPDGLLTGTPTAVDTGSMASNGTWAVHLGASANFLFAIRSDLTTSDVLSYPLDADGNLGTPTTGDANSIAFGGAVDPTEQFFYVANSASSDITAFRIDADTGALTLINSFATGNAPSDLAIDPSGRFLYVVHRGDGTISAFNISSATGELTEVGGPAGTVSTGIDPIDIVIDATGRHLIVANQVSNTLDSYRINVNPNNLTANGSLIGVTTMSLVGAPRALRIDAANSALFVATSDTGSVMTYEFDDQTGALILSDTETSGSAMTRALATYPR